MKNKTFALIIAAGLVLALAGCGSVRPAESGAPVSGAAVEPIPEPAAEPAAGPVTEPAAESPAGPVTEPAAASDAGQTEERVLSEEQAVSAVKAYCCSVNPDLAEIAEAGEYPVYWDISSADGQEIVVVFRSYTGALQYFYIDRASGDAYVTEYVPGITEEETRTEETLNVWDYLE